MSSILGSNGELVISESLREALAIEPGSVVVQKLNNDHIELHFYPPEHDRSLRGILASLVHLSLDSGAWHEVRAKAWAASVSGPA